MSLRGALLHFATKQSPYTKRLLRHTCPGGRRQGRAARNDMAMEQIMTTISSDTHPKMEALQIQFIQRMPSWKKMSMVDDLNETVKSLAISGIKQRRPEATPEEIRRMLAELILGAELARKVYDHAR